MGEPCTCAQCRIRRAAFGSDATFGAGEIPFEKLEDGVMALAIIFGLAVAEGTEKLAVRAISTFVKTQNEARLTAEGAGSISSMEVAGHG